MTPHDPLDALKTAWRADAADAGLSWIPADELALRARRLARRVAWRNVQEWLAAGVVVVGFASYAIASDRWLTQVGCVWTVGAALWIAWVLVRRGRNLAPPAWDAPMSEYLRYQRSQLERQATLLERVPTWYALPLAVGTALILGDRVRELLERGAPAWGVLGIAFAILLSLGVYLFVLVVNRRAARELRRQLLLLDHDD